MFFGPYLKEPQKHCQNSDNKKRLSYGPSRQECTKCLTLEILGHKHKNDSTDTAFMDPRARVSQVKWK